MQVIRVGFVNSNGETRGCEKAPLEILKELKNIKSNERKELVEFEKLNLDEFHVNLLDLKESDYIIFRDSKEAFDKNFKCFFIGGDHSIDYSIVRAFDKVESNPLLIVFDAHADLKGEGFNKKWLGKLIADEWFSPSSIILISTRNMDEEEIKFLKKNNITVIGMDVLHENLEDVCDLVMERARKSSRFYVSIDMDCLDPCFAPGAVDLEAGGMSSRDLIYFARRLSFLKNFGGASITEINPEKDINNITLKLGARLIAEMI